MTEMGRPTKAINWDHVDKLCTLQCTAKEIASFFDMSVDTLTRRCKDEFGLTFAEYFAQKKGSGRISLRRLQWKSAEDGNVSMLIWLGKQYLGQSDKADMSHNFPKPTVIKRSTGDDVVLGAIESPDEVKP